MGKAESPLSVDVLIIGAGLVGNSLALALTGYAKIALIEANPFNATSVVDERALVLSFSAQRIFAALHMWEKIQPHSTPVKQVHVSEAGHFGATRFSAADYAVDALGYVVTAQTLSDILRQSVLAQSAIDTFYAASVQQITPFPDGYRVQVKTADGMRTFTTRLLIGADGMQSLTRELLGITVKYQDHAQTACTARITLTRSHQNIAYERFAQEEVLAALPVDDHQAAIVWTVSSERANVLKNLPDTDFCTQFQAAFGHRLGRLLSVQKRQTYPLRSTRALEQIRPHAVLLGNAAHTLHPVAAQGFNLSLRDAAVLAQIIMDAIAAGNNPGSLTVLQTYRDWREKEQLETIKFTQGIIRAFSQKTLAWQLLKETGLLSLEILPFVKNLIGRHAMGISDRTPKWVVI